MSKLTKKVAVEFVRILGGRLYRDSYGDLRVKFGDQIYFTNDLDDAVGTARIMRGSCDAMEDAEEYLRSQSL